ncbi:MAG: hypothetical protein IPN73_10155 [Saprospiraceae bacterium]|nr:hypothetical protein [Saprospiraceae bacterium]MBK9690044.1 hypothetical protein [Saprospiraceae bacterium]
MKIIKRSLLMILLLTAVGILFRGWIYRHSLSYKAVGMRTTYPARNKIFTQYIDSCIDHQNEPDIKHIIKLALSITSEKLNYTANKNDNDPNKLITTQKAHCVGYAAFFTTTCNYLLAKNNLSNQWTAKPRIGQLYFLGTNVHPYFHSSFFKNHDFVTIENNKTGEIFAVDPTVKDYLSIDFISLTK